MSPWGQQREQSVGRVAGVFDNPPGFPCTPPGVDILEGGKLTSNNVAGSSHDPLQSPAVASGAVSKPGGDTAGQDALHSAGVEGSEDSGARSKLPQPSQEEETLMCLLQHCICDILILYQWYFYKLAWVSTHTLIYIYILSLVCHSNNTINVCH